MVYTLKYDFTLQLPNFWKNSYVTGHLSDGSPVIFPWSEGFQVEKIRLLFALFNHVRKFWCRWGVDFLMTLETTVKKENKIALVFTLRDCSILKNSQVYIK